jgi:hypothetical protein
VRNRKSPSSPAHRKASARIWSRPTAIAITGRRQFAFDQAVLGPGHPGGSGRHRRSEDGAAHRFAGARALRPHRHPRQQCRHLHRQALHRLYRGRLRLGACRQSRKLLPSHQTCRRRNAEAGLGPHRADHDQPDRPRQQQRSLGAGVADQGRAERRHQIAGDGVRGSPAKAPIRAPRRSRRSKRLR